MEPLNNQARSLTVYSVIAHADGKDTYLRVGSGYGDGCNATLVLDAIPINGKLVVRAWDPGSRPPTRRRAVGASV